MDRSVSSLANVMVDRDSFSLAYVGSIVPDETQYHNIAFSRAGNMCQLSLVNGLVKAGLVPSDVHSLRPVATFPRARQILFRKSYAIVEKAIQLSFIPFINITPIKQFSVGINVLLSLLKWGWSFRNYKHRIIFSFNITVPPGIFILAAAFMTRSKSVAMIYDVNVPGETVPKSMLSCLDFWMHKHLLKKFDALVVITDAIAMDFAPCVSYLRVEGGISPDLIAKYEMLDATQSRNPVHFTIVTAGRLDEANGIREILTAFSKIEGDAYRLHIAGAGPLEDEVMDAVKKDSRITFHGFLPFDEILKLYASADVLVCMRLTQRINTRYFFPSKTMEYLASGVPVITTCPGSMAEEYGALAYLLHEETPDALADLVKTVAAVPQVQRAARGKAAREFMARHKTWDAQAARVVRFLDEVAGSRLEVQ